MKIKVKNIEFLVNEKFNQLFWNYVSSGKWEPHTFEIIDNFVSENSSVIDIGSWIGPISLFMAGKGAQVYSVEPDPVAYQELISNLKLNPALDQRIQSFNFAIAPEDKEIKLYARKSHGDSSSSILNRIEDTNDHIYVKGVSFSHFLKMSKLTQVDFIKMDIEGGEFEVLPAIAPMLEKLGMPTVFVSFHYSYLNEFLYKKKIRLRFLSRLLMKAEKILNYSLFKTKIAAMIKSAISFSEKYKYIYTESGEEIKSANLSPSIMVKSQINLVLSNKKWVNKNANKELD